MGSFGIIGGGAVLFTASAVTGTGILPLLGGLYQIMAHFNTGQDFLTDQSSRHWDSWGSFGWRSGCVKSYVHIAILQVAMLFKITYIDPVSGTLFRFNDTISSCTKPGQDPASAVYSLKQEEEHPAQDHARGLICPRLPKGGKKSDLVARLYHEEYLKIHCTVSVRNTLACYG